MPAIEALPLLIRAKIDVAPSGCWLWMAAARNGYGVVRWDGRLEMAHRVTYRLLVGDPGPELDHLCRVTRCCNPSYVEPVTHSLNVQRGTAGEVTSHVCSLPRSCPSGHAMVGENLYLYVKRDGVLNRMCRTCRRESKQRRRAAGARD